MGWRWTPLANFAGPDRVALVWDVDGQGLARPRARIRRLLIPGGCDPPRDALLNRITFAWLIDLLEDDVEDHPVATRVLPDSRIRGWCHLLVTGERASACASTTDPTRLLEAVATLLGLAPFGGIDVRNVASDSPEVDLAGLPSACHHSPLADVLGEQALRACARHRVDELIATVPGAVLELDHRPLLQELLLRLHAGEPSEDLAWLAIDAVAESIIEALGWRHASTASAADPIALFPSVLAIPALHARIAERLTRLGLRRMLRTEERDACEATVSPTKRPR